MFQTTHQFIVLAVIFRKALTQSACQNCNKAAINTTSAKSNLRSENSGIHPARWQFQWRMDEKLMINLSTSGFSGPYFEAQNTG